MENSLDEEKEYLKEIEEKEYIDRKNLKVIFQNQSMAWILKELSNILETDD